MKRKVGKKEKKGRNNENENKGVHKTRDRSN